MNRLADKPAGVALPPLLDAARDEDKRVRLAAYEILSRFENEETARKAVFAGLADSDIAIVDAVTALLKAMRPMDCEALVDLLDSENPTAVAASIDLLAHARHRDCAASLQALLDDERKPAFRGATIGQLARQALKAIESSSIDDGEGTAAPGDSSGAAGESDPREYSDEEKIIRTLNALRDDDWGRTRKAAKFLRRFARRLRGSDNPQILRLLAEALDDDNWSLRWASAEALAMLKDPAAIPALSARIEDPNWIVQVAVARALVELGAVGLASELAPLLQKPAQSRPRSDRRSPGGDGRPAGAARARPDAQA